MIVVGVASATASKITAFVQAEIRAKAANERKSKDRRLEDERKQKAEEAEAEEQQTANAPPPALDPNVVNNPALMQATQRDVTLATQQATQQAEAIARSTAQQATAAAAKKFTRTTNSAFGAKRTRFDEGANREHSFHAAAPPAQARPRGNSAMRPYQRGRGTPQAAQQPTNNEPYGAQHPPHDQQQYYQAPQGPRPPAYPPPQPQTVYDPFAYQAQPTAAAQPMLQQLSHSAFQRARSRPAVPRSHRE